MSRHPPESAGALPQRGNADPQWQPTEILSRPGAGTATGRGNALSPGVHLAEFELLRVLGEGGFGIVYLAQDHTLQRRVAIKEYMPASLAMRSEAQQVVVTAERHRPVFNAGLDSFINEARLLAQFDHPSLLKVYRFWRANGTAYMVMPYYEGRTLKQLLREGGPSPDERWLRALLASLTEALAVVHAERCLHRDIAPDNILLLAESGRPLLLDFGAARQVIGDATQALTAILKPGYAPVEQYAEMPALKQGPWTDIYALCAVVYAAIMGRKPPASVGRTVVDHCVPLEQSAAGRYSPSFLRAIDAGLQVLPDHRPASVHAFRQLLGLDGQVPPPTQNVGHSASSTAASAVGNGGATPVQARLSAALARHGVMAGRIGLAVLLLAVVGAAFWAGRRLSSAADPPGASPADAPIMSPAALPASPTPAPQVALDTSPSGPAYTASSQASVATLPAPTTAAPATTRIWSTSDEFQRLLRDRDDSFDVQASADAPRLRIGRDRLRFRVRAARDGHVYVLVGGPDGSLLLLFPNRMSADNRIRAGQTLVLPQPSWPLDTADPPGTEQFAVVVSEHPRDFSHLSKKRDAWFLDLPTGTAGAALAHDHAGPGSVVAGKARCNSPGCDRYGAALFNVEVVN
jgi:hypothetical protein